MNVLIAGGGGREHALAWKLASSKRLAKVFVAPGNAGTACEPGVTNVELTDIAALVEFARSEPVAMTIVGPEAPLAAGIVDAFRAVVRAWDGRGASTMLTTALLDLTVQPSVDQLYLALFRQQVPKTAFRATTRLVFAAAAAGDTVAQDILQRVGDELGLADEIYGLQLAPPPPPTPGAGVTPDD